MSDIFQCKHANVTATPLQVILNFGVNIVTLILGVSQSSVVHMHNWTGIMRYSFLVVQVLIADAVLVSYLSSAK